MCKNIYLKKYDNNIVKLVVAKSYVFSKKGLKFAY